MDDRDIPQVEQFHIQIYKRPETYIGSMNHRDRCTYALFREGTGFRARNIDVVFPEGLENCLLELLCNAGDNIVRSEKRGLSYKPIEVKIDGNLITVTNRGGVSIPVVKTKQENIDGWAPELAFGQLLSSTNYNDEETDRLTSGRNGVGAKACNIFGTMFEVDVVCDGSRFQCCWFNNMKECGDITISTEDSENRVSITWTPDLVKFQITELPPDFANIVSMYLLLLNFGRGIPVIMRSEAISFKLEQKISINQFCDIVYPGTKRHISRANVYQRGKDQTIDAGKMEYAIIDVKGGKLGSVSMINTVPTRRGGTHIHAIKQTTVKGINTRLNKKYAVKCNIATYCKHLFVVARAEIFTPTFVEQFKKTLDSPIVIEADDSFTAEGWHIDEWIKAKAARDRTRSTRRSKICKPEHGAVDCNWSGTDNSDYTSLLICEGSTAKNAAETVRRLTLITLPDGREARGADIIGIFPTNGNPVNARNEEKMHSSNLYLGLVDMLKIHRDVDYTDKRNKMRYGRIELFADADADGAHICALLIYMFHVNFPSIIKAGYLHLRRTPIIRSYLGLETRKFLTYNRFNVWMKSLTDDERAQIETKYYKGLASSTDKDIEESMNDTKVCRFIPDEKSHQALEILFSEDTTVRKQWMFEEIGEDAYLEDDEIKISDYINCECKYFSLLTLPRSIASCYDGYKESQRKILYTLLTVHPGDVYYKNEAAWDKQSLKVTALASETQVHACYHHGETSLHKAIATMARNTVGANNLPLLEARGQYGSRSSSIDGLGFRYLHTGPAKYMCKIHRKEDNRLINVETIDGDDTRIKYLFPIIPMLLVNGTRGVATGWNNSFEMHNPVDICLNIIEHLRHGTPLKKPKVWYRGFEGKVEDRGNKISTRGKVFVDGDTITIYDLPVYCKIEKFLELLYELKKDKHIKTFDDLGGKDGVPKYQIVKPTSEGLKQIKTFIIETKSVDLMNAAGDDKCGYKPILFKTTLDYLQYFVEWRLDIYVRRQNAIIMELNAKIAQIEDKLLFIESVNRGDLIIKGRKTKEIHTDMIALGIKDPNILARSSVSDLSYDGFERCLKQIKNINQEICEQEEKSITDIWIEELEELLSVIS